MGPLCGGWEVVEEEEEDDDGDRKEKFYVTESYLMQIYIWILQLDADLAFIA